MYTNVEDDEIVHFFRVSLANGRSTYYSRLPVKMINGLTHSFTQDMLRHFPREIEEEIEKGEERKEEKVNK